MKPTKWKPRYPKERSGCPCGCQPNPSEAWVGGYNGMAHIVGCKSAVDSWIKERERK